MALPPTTGAPLNLYVPAFDYGANPGDDTTYDVVLNDNFVALNNFASTVALLLPTVSQIITQPATTYFNMNAPMVFGALPTLRFGVLANIWDTSLSRPAPGVLSVDSSTPGNSAGTIKAAVVNTTTGYQFDGAAPAGHILVGNGTDYVDSATIPVTAANYQIVEQTGTPVTQRNKLNFLSPMTVADDPGNASTDIGVNIVIPPPIATQNVTTNTYNTIYQNTSGSARFVSVSSITAGGSGGNAIAQTGPTSGSLVTVATAAGQAVAGVAGEYQVFFIVPDGWFYQVQSINSTFIVVWTEWNLG